jgi:hypothetical protein
MIYMRSATALTPDSYRCSIADTSEDTALRKLSIKIWIRKTNPILTDHRWTDDDGVEHLKLSMPSYVDDLYQKWKSYMSDTTEPESDLRIFSCTSIFIGAAFC